jgi:hypothetical protein
MLELELETLCSYERRREKGVVGTGRNPREAIENSESRAGRLLERTDYDLIMYGISNLVIRNDAVYYVIRDATFVKIKIEENQTE